MRQSADCGINGGCCGASPSIYTHAAAGVRPSPVSRPTAELSPLDGVEPSRAEPHAHAHAHARVPSRAAFSRRAPAR